MARSERLRLAALILQDLAQGDPEVLDYADSWSDEDLKDLQNSITAEIGKRSERDRAAVQARVKSTIAGC